MMLNDKPKTIAGLFGFALRFFGIVEISLFVILTEFFGHPVLPVHDDCL